MEEASAEKISFPDALSGMANAFIDPAETARQSVKKGFWIWPLAILCIAFAVFSYLITPITLRVIQMNPPPNLTPEQFQRAFPMIRTMTYAGIGLAPVFIILFTLLAAWLVNMACSMFAIQTKFRHVFSLIAACSLITILQLAASYIVLRMKGDDIQSTQELQPPFGLDIFFSGLKGPLFAILNFFSIFEIWYIVVLGFGLAYMARTSKGKAFAAITPAWLVPLIFKILGSFFQRG